MWQYHTKEVWDKRLKSGDGDVMYMCHTDVARAKALNTIGSRYNGDLMGQCHTEEARVKAEINRRNTNMQNWDGDICGMMHTPDARKKAVESTIKSNMLKYGEQYAYQCGQMNTPEAICKSRKSMLFNSINYYLKQLEDDGAPQPITWDIYWNWSDGFISYPANHVRRILNFIEELRKDNRWTPLMESIFSEAEKEFNK